jgi:hypothetical protein
MAQANSNDSIRPTINPATVEHHPMCPLPWCDWDTLNQIKDRLQELKYMAEFAAELAQGLNGDGAEEGYFRIQHDEGSRLAFCCFELLRRSEDD